MSNGDRSKWDYLLDMGVVEFLNYMAYLSDKTKYETQLREEAKREARRGN
jgi:hypothetical protein